MSSLAAARADNFYYPPEWTPKQGNLNKFHGQHALRERARKIDQGILIIRFEMPYNIWCGGCNSMIAKGVRFNAEKKQVGNYYSTKIWSFSMKSACCKHEIVIQTDPKNCEYVIISGAQKKTEDYDIEDAETLILPPDEERGKLADPFYRLEHGEKDLQKKKETEPVLVRLQRVSDSRHSDNYALNKALRAQLRASHCGYDNLSLVPIHEHHHPLRCVWIKDFDKEMEKLKGSYSSYRLNPSAFHFLVPYLNPLSKYSHNNVFIDFPICQNQKKRVAEEEVASRKRGLGVRLLPASEEDAAVAASVKFSSKFERNRKEKRALIKAASIFPGSSGPSTSNAKRMELESKRRKIKAAAASSLLVGGFKPSSWSQSAVSSGRQRKV